MDIELSRRERDVLQMTWNGLSQKEIAIALSLAQNTVKNLRDRVGLKLKARTNVQVVRRALEKGLIQV